MSALDGNLSDLIYYWHLATVVNGHFHHTTYHESKYNISEFLRKARTLMGNDEFVKILSNKPNVWMHNVLAFHGITEYEGLKWKEK